MDQITTDVRMAEWTALIRQCQGRPEGQTAKQWLEENGVSAKQYYYWLRKVRQQVFEQKAVQLPTESCRMSSNLALIELPDDEKNTPTPMITIRTKKVSIEITGATEELAVKLIKAVRHAI
ncbi:MAG: IS66 family insertion sequence element accessory protein TnpB [Lachnospiraceae bacterium]|nr:IS66 family insertion sequence element accessory protein TnpB [Lachnospiraceae bacterium]